MLGVALGYTVQSRFVDHGNFMTGGFDHTTQRAFSHDAAKIARFRDLTNSRIASFCSTSSIGPI